MLDLVVAMCRFSISPISSAELHGVLVGVIVGVSVGVFVGFGVHVGVIVGAGVAVGAACSRVPSHGSAYVDPSEAAYTSNGADVAVGVAVWACAIAVTTSSIATAKIRTV
jgi:hypothetical protein